MKHATTIQTRGRPRGTCERGLPRCFIELAAKLPDGLLRQSRAQLLEYIWTLLLASVVLLTRRERDVRGHKDVGGSGRVVENEIEQTDAGPCGWQQIGSTYREQHVRAHSGIIVQRRSPAVVRRLFGQTTRQALQLALERRSEIHQQQSVKRFVRFWVMSLLFLGLLAWFCGCRG
jgi:hypothetical protein